MWEGEVGVLKNSQQECKLFRIQLHYHFTVLMKIYYPNHEYSRMSFKEQRIKIYKIPNYLLAALLIIFVMEIGFSLINSFYPNPFLTVIIKSITDGYQSIANIVIGAIIASIVGIFSSVAIMDLRAVRDRDNLILSFYYELKELNEKIQNIPSEEIDACSKWLLIEKNPVYSDSGLFFIFRKEMCSLEQPCLEKMLPIYSKIIFVEQQWENIHQEKPRLDPDTPRLLTQLKREMNEFLPVLESEKQKIQ